MAFQQLIFLAALVVATSYWFPYLEATANCSTDHGRKHETPLGTGIAAPR